MAPPTDFNDYFRQRCKELGMSVSEVARRSGLSRAAIYKLLEPGGMAQVRIATLTRLADALDVHPQWLLRTFFLDMGTSNNPGFSVNLSLSP